MHILLGFALCFLGLDSCVVLSESCLGLDMVYHLIYFHVMFSICGDNDNCKCQHGNT